MPDQTARAEAQRIIAENRKALHDYHILETFEAGVVLQGTEVKSIRDGRVNLRDSFAPIAGTPTTSRRGAANCCCIARRSAS